MTTQTSVPPAGTSPFAHLARAAGVAAPAAGDDKNKSAAAAAEDDDKKEDDKEDKAKKAKAEDSEDDDKKEDDKDAKGKKAKAEDDEEGDDDSDREDDSDAKARAARGRERGRIQAIVLSEAGKANPVAAMTLACGSSMSRKQAISMLTAMGPAPAPAKRDGLGGRMAAVPQPDIGDDAEMPAPGSAQATAAGIIAAGKKARGEK